MVAWVTGVYREVEEGSVVVWSVRKVHILAPFRLWGQLLYILGSSALSSSSANFIRIPDNRTFISTIS
jgi:hypothetical protein